VRPRAAERALASAPVGDSGAGFGAKGRQFVVVMVGLPARGKTYTARRLARYLSWLGYPTRVFNLGDARRARLGAQQSAAFFDPRNLVALRRRNALADEVLEEAASWLESGGRVAIYDATNTTRERREHVRTRCEAAGYPVFFIEVICDDASMIDANVRETKLSSPDYAGVDPDEAVRDFRRRIAFYDSVYERVAEDEGPSLKIVDRGKRVVMTRIEGYLPSRIVFFLMNLQITTRPIWITRHGESTDNLLGRIGGDAPLSERGRQYARELAHYVDGHFGRGGDELRVWASTLKRTVETASFLGRPFEQWRTLDEIDAGVCEGMTYRQIAERMPLEYAARGRDKLRYRYPSGESYEDVIQRLDRVIVELERQRRPVLVIGHQAVLRSPRRRTSRSRSTR
jgi:broad specificity phosphatase PhoE/predicted kinase